MDLLKAANLFSVQRMVFVITGGGSGLGEMMALALDMNGAAQVYILGRRKLSLDNVAAKAHNHSIIPVVCDTSSKDSLAAAVATIEARTPFVNVVIANAAISGPITGYPGRPEGTTVAEIRSQLWSIPSDDFTDVMNINILGAFNTFLAFLELLDAGNSHPDSVGKDMMLTSQFITTTSLGGFSRKEEVSHIYDVSKAALIHLTKKLSTGFAKHKIRVNSISPGLYVTEMTEFMAGGQDLSVPGSMPIDFIPSTRTGNAQDIAGAILYLCSRAGSFVNGNIILTDGGAVSLVPASY